MLPVKDRMIKIRHISSMAFSSQADYKKLHNTQYFGIHLHNNYTMIGKNLMTGVKKGKNDMH